METIFSGRSSFFWEKIDDGINNDPVTILTELIQIYFLRKFIANSSGTHESIK